MSLPATLAFEYPTIERLADFLIATLFATEAENPSADYGSSCFTLCI